MKHFATLTLIGALAGCDGSITELPSEAPVVVPGTERPAGEPSLSPLRRLTRVEYVNTVQDLFGADVPVPELDEDLVLGSYDTSALEQSMSLPVAQAYVSAAETIGAWAAERAEGCSETEGAQCAYLSELGRRAYRRPLRQEEQDALTSIYDAAAAEGDHASGIEWVVAALLQSPHFLYLVEVGGTETEGLRPISGYELATRLSYALWSTMPDDALFAAAADGSLDDEEGVRAQAQRMLADPRARPVLTRFVFQWLQLTKLADVVKDEATFPSFSDALRADWLEETTRFVEHVVFDVEGSAGELFVFPQTFLNARLSEAYGFGEVDGDAMELVDVPDNRTGLFTQGSFLALHATPEFSNPIERGAVARTVFLCDDLPEPPDSVFEDEISAPEPGPGSPVRRSLDALTSGAQCAGCHARINPIGYIFESYDALGRFRSEDRFGNPIDNSGLELVSFEDPELAGPVADAVDFSHQVASSEQMRVCLSKQLFHFALGRAPRVGDREEIDRMADAAADSFLDMVVELSVSDAFRFRRSAE